jgi:ribonuclease D
MAPKDLEIHSCCSATFGLTSTRLLQGTATAMRTLTTTDALAAFCERARNAAYVTVDTEFLRERTYFPQLCLIQMALPHDDGADAGDPSNAVLVDPIAGQLDLAPFFELLADQHIVKVLHAARQDVEIFWTQGSVIPAPLFDTQVAAMVCGFGEQAGYETLVRGICKASVDKSSRFTDWSRRPLSEAQKAYALADVTWLRGIYLTLSRRLAETGREGWVSEEIAVLTDPATYVVEPADAWRRIKTRTQSRPFLTLVRELARFRETHARERDVPRNRVLKDDAILEIASARPRNDTELGRLRLVQREARKDPVRSGILEAVEAALACPPEDQVVPEPTQRRAPVDPALADLLRVLLKSRAETAGVAQKLIAPVSDLDAIAAGARDVPALSGWRHEVFGADALRLCAGEIALSARDGAVQTVAL